MIALRGKGNCLPLPTSMKKEQKAKKIEKLKRTKNERRRSNLQIFKKKDLKKRKKKKDKTYIHGYKMGKKNETIKKRKRNCSHDWFQNEETNKMKKMRKKKKKRRCVFRSRFVLFFVVSLYALRFIAIYCIIDEIL